MGQQVGRVGEGTSTGLQPPQPHATQTHQAKGIRGSGAGRRPREPGSITGTPPSRTPAANVPDPGINIFTQHSGKSNTAGKETGKYIFIFHCLLLIEPLLAQSMLVWQRRVSGNSFAHQPSMSHPFSCLFVGISIVCKLRGDYKCTTKNRFSQIWHFLTLYLGHLCCKLCTWSSCS